MVDLKGKAVLVTGASRGIGAATARVLAEAGALVGLMSRDARAISPLADEIGGMVLEGDVARAADMGGRSRPSVIARAGWTS